MATSYQTAVGDSFVLLQFPAECSVCIMQAWNIQLFVMQKIYHPAYQMHSVMLVGVFLTGDRSALFVFVPAALVTHQC